MIFTRYENLCSVCNSSLFEKEIEGNICLKENKPLCLHHTDEITSEFIQFFEKAIGEPRSIQIFWARRIFQNESFATVAPTGIGKTSFGIAMALFLAGKGKKSYLIFPTTLLVDQAVEKISQISEKVGKRVGLNEQSDVTVCYYHGKMKKSEKESFFETLESKSYHILITTTAFLSKNFEEIKNTFDFIFVDDVDAVLKASKNVERIIQLLGFVRTKDGWRGTAKGVLMVSTATAKKGQKVRLFRELLNFDVGTTTHSVRNIEDIMIESSDIETLRKILRRMGSGGVIYARSTEEAEKIYESLREEFKIGIVSAKSKKDYERFERGEIDHIVGTAYYYGTLVRGLDLPEKIRFVVFVKAPVFRVKIEDLDSLSNNMLRTLALIFRDDERVKKYIPYLSSLKEGQADQLRSALREILQEGNRRGKDVIIREMEIIFPDIRTYIQGSGRASRLFAGGITKGASFLLEDEEDVRNAFIERARYYDVEFKKAEDVDFDALVKEINESRQKFMKRHEMQDLIKPTLFIVESPTKAKQIARFFGQPSIKAFNYDSGVSIVYEVPTAERVLLITASLGHITDLITNRAFHGVEVEGNIFRPIYSSIKKCRDCGYQFTEEREDCPRCGGKNVDDSKRRIEFLRRLAKQTGHVIIGTDPDSEGEKIAWDIANLLKGCGEIKRAEFHEVTRRAILKALNELRDIDQNLVRAQIVRRIEDRWIGFVLSQKLWEVFKNRNLSAGRAQTPVLGWIIERFNESREKRKVAFIESLGLYLEDVESDTLEIEIQVLERRVESRTPLPPYTTDTMLRDASNILKVPAGETMRLAQELFESGLITYHRTDSTTVSEVGLRVAEEYLGEDFAGRRWEAEGAHECIRPTRPLDRYDVQRLIQEGVIQAENITWRHLSLYDLIFRRFMASQCKNYEVEIVRYRITADSKEFDEERAVNARGRAFELYKSVWVRKELPEGKHKVKAKLLKVPKAPLYTQSDVISLMKERGIGRPSTYATIIEKLFLRKYVIERGGKLIPTETGRNVFDYLVKNYEKFVSESRTRLLEEKMDEIEKGIADYIDVLEDMYTEISEIS
ncbi:reverse gyrase [Geoglobus acetivorans]|uniref:Reverse gyrase n=1 Tax=Geoglobus acetivorans TaxID=565033 RepID=A0ABZ3H3X3_GEOAI|nr:reverse gyrase [Geoglobus acetivorans]